MLAVTSGRSQDNPSEEGETAFASVYAEQASLLLDAQLVAQRPNPPPDVVDDLRRFSRFFTDIERRASLLQQEVPDDVRPPATILDTSRAHLQTVSDRFGVWPASLAHLAVGVLALLDTRPSGTSAADTCLLLHIALGTHDAVLKAHGGELWLWSSTELCWVHHDEAVPWDIVRRVQRYFTLVCGLLRSLPGSLKREPITVLRAIDATFENRGRDEAEAFGAWEERAMLAPPSTGRASSRGRGRGRSHSHLDSGAAADEGGEDETTPAPSWPVFLSKRALDFGRAAEDLLVGGTHATLFGAWCSVPMKRLPGCAYRDVAFAYDVNPNLPLERVSWNRRREFYFAIPHPLLSQDPCLGVAMSRLRTFYEQSFWGNFHAVDACFAALALAKRGINVDPVFFMWGPGGVGLSLTTAHLHACLGPRNHRFFDPQAFYLDEEMRKQVEQLRGGTVFTAQERPEGMSKNFRLDIFKKLATGEGLFARMPYGPRTKTVHLVGWKRMELNKHLRIGGITETNFNSIFRRALVVEMRSAFVDAEWHDSHVQSSYSRGVFPRQNDLAAFMTSPPAIAAGLVMQHLFEDKNGRSACEDIITKYRLGGLDRGSTWRCLREACDLPLIPPGFDVNRPAGSAAARRSADPTGVPPSTAPVDTMGVAGSEPPPAASQSLALPQRAVSKGAGPLEEFPLVAMARASGELNRDATRDRIILRHLKQLSRGGDCITKRQLTNDVKLEGYRGPKGKETAWEEVTNSSSWKKVEGNQGTRAGVSYMPVLRARTPFVDIVPEATSAAKRMQVVYLAESHRVDLLMQYAHRAGRQDNWALLLRVLERAPVRSKGAPRKGRPIDLGDEFRERAESLGRVSSRLKKHGGSL
jgi:hypothetical protein